LKIFSILLLLFILFSCGKKDKKVNPSKISGFVFLSYGLSDISNRHIVESVDEKWNIRRIAVAGCVVTEELIDSVRTENNKTELALEQQYGKDWKNRYEEDLRNFQQKEIDIMDILISSEAFRQQLGKCKLPIDEIVKTVRQRGNSEIYTVDIFDPQNQDKICFKAEVDIRKRTVKII